VASEGLGKRIAAARKKKGLSQNRLGELAGFTKGYVSRLEAEKRGTKNPSADMIDKVADILGVDAVELRGGLPPPGESAPARVIELFDRYPNLQAAIGKCRDDVLSVTIERIKRIALHYPSDLEIGEWVHELLRLDAQFRREMKTGEALGRDIANEDDAPPFGR
jgi:transcriptional regulator with XRE-family HTH domain